MATFAAAFLVVVLAQILVGAYLTERGNFSDEAAHFMNGLLIRDYLWSGAHQNPLAFAQAYYLDYPKIAPGMWPPLFHAVLGLVLLPGWSPQTAALALVALASAWTAWRLGRILERLTSREVAWSLAGLMLLMPAMLNLTSAVMLDVVVAAFLLEAAFWLAEFFETGHSKHAALFGVFAAGACLTKGNGLAVLMMPVLMLLFTRRFWLLRRPGLHIAAAILLLASPVVMASFYLDAAIGDFRFTTWTDVVSRSAYYTAHLRRQLGLLPLILAGVAMAGLMLQRADSGGRPGARSQQLGLAALLAAGIAFHLLNPHKVFTGRYVTMAVAPIIGLMPVGLSSVLSWIRRPHWLETSRRVLVATVAVSVLFSLPIIAKRRPMGFRDAAEYIQSHGGLAGRSMMVISDEDGEGAMVAEVAARSPHPSSRVIRASKLMASDDWAGTSFQLRFASGADLETELEALHVDYLVVDPSLERSGHPLWPQTQELLHADALERTYVASGTRGVVIYRLTRHAAGAPKPMHIVTSSPLGPKSTR